MSSGGGGGVLHGGGGWVGGVGGSAAVHQPSAELGVDGREVGSFRGAAKGPGIGFGGGGRGGVWLAGNSAVSRMRSRAAQLSS